MITVISSRRDGLGARLRSLLNAMVLAEAVSGRFVFHWGALDEAFEAKFVDTLPVEEMFSERFIAQHHMTPKEIKALSAAPVPKDIAAFLSSVSSNSSQAYLASGSEQLVGVSPAVDGGAFARAFERIEFSPALAAAKEAARQANIADTTFALHIRSGDLVHGQYRYYGTLESKIVPLQIAEHLIRSRPETSFLVFCQDREILARLKGLANVQVPDDLADTAQFNGTQRALFEICLMSRCSKIIAGSSAFALVAALLSNRTLDAIGDYLTPEECVDVAFKCIEDTAPAEGVSPKQRAMTAWWSILRFRKLLRAADQLKLVRFARKMDPLNPQFWMHECFLLNGKGRTREVEEALFSALILNDEAMDVFLSNVRVMMRRPSAQKRGLARMESFATSARKEGRMSMFVYAQMARQLDAHDEAEIYARRLKALSGLCTDMYSKLEQYL